MERIIRAAIRHVKPKSILHVGASIGQELSGYQCNGVKRVVWVEAMREPYQVLKDKVRDIPGHTVINALVTDKDGDVRTFHIASTQAASSMYRRGYCKKTHPHIKEIGCLELTTRRLDTLLREHGIQEGSFDMIVFDIQGAELLALWGLGKYINATNVIVSEVSRIPLGHGGCCYAEIKRFMKRNGFKLWKQIIRKTGCGDAIFIRPGVKRRDQVNDY